MTGDLMFWLGWIGTFVLYVAMIYIAWRALFGDTYHGKRRCPQCWHDLSHTPGMTCSECGFTAEREAHFHKRRRHKMVALLAVLVCLVAAVVLNWQVDQRGWIGLAPTKALIWTLPLTIENGGAAVTELERRMRVDQLSDGEWMSLLERLAQGDSSREPVSDEWVRTYGTLLHSWRRRLAASLALEIATERSAGMLDGPAATFAKNLDELLLSIPAKVVARTRADWPEGVTPRVNITLQDWWPVDYDVRMRVKPIVEDAKSVLVYRTSTYRPNVPYSLAVPGAASGTVAGELELDVRVERRRGDGDQWKLADEQRVVVNELDHSIAGLKDAAQSPLVMEAVSDEQLDKAMQQAFGQGIVQWPSGPSPVRFRVNIPATAGSNFAGIAVGVKVELKRAGRLARRLDLWWLGGSPVDQRYGFEIAYENTELLKALAAYNPATDTDWTLTVTGDVELAQRAGPAGRYWSGSVAVPLAVVQQGGTSPPRPWWTQQQLDDEAQGEYSVLE